MTGKYEALTRHLAGTPERRTTLSFQRIEDLIGDRLPRGARLDHTWWANTRDPDREQSRSWLGAGWKVDEVNLATESVTFVLIGA